MGRVITGTGGRDLAALPKVDLHLHLENSVRPSTLRELAVGNGVELPAALAGDAYAFAHFGDFFVQNALVRECLDWPEDFGRVAYELCEDQVRQSVAYAEVSFTVGAHGERLGDWEGPLAAVLDGLARGEEAFGVRCRLVLDHSRRRPVAQAWRTLEVALAHREQVVALGLAGDEAHPGEPFAGVFEAAAEAGLHRVPHAGEAAGPQSVREALSLLRAQRLGHGFRALEDPGLVAELRARGVALEVCPSSNVALGLVPSYGEHPLPRLLDAGLAVTLNTDVPAMTGVPLAAEYERARGAFGLGDAALAGLARAGVEASFADEATKAGLRQGIGAWLADGAVP